MSKKTIYTVSVLVACFGLTIVFIYFSFIRMIVPATQVILKEVQVSESHLQMTVDFSSSALWYRGYTIRHDDDKLYLQIRGTGLAWFGESLPVRVSVPLGHNKVQEVYLESEDVEAVLVWQRGEEV